MISKIQEFVGINGKFDVIMDCVSSGHEIDSCHLYESKLKQFVIDSGSYLIIGGFTSDWIAAGIKRLTGLNLFSKGRELIWIKFENTSNDLANIARLFDQGAIKSRIFRHVEFSSDGIKEAFELLKGRRTVGKIVVDVEGS